MIEPAAENSEPSTLEQSAPDINVAGSGGVDSTFKGQARSDSRHNDPEWDLATFRHNARARFGIGLIPEMPGTMGSLAALPLARLLFSLGDWPAVAAAAVVIFAIGWWASAELERHSDTSDPSYIVVDEVAGQLIPLILVPPDWLLYALGFGLFRFFDIVKPWPVSWADREIKGGLGVMFDDVLAGLFAAIVLAVASQFLAG